MRPRALGDRRVRGEGRHLRSRLRHPDQNRQRCPRCGGRVQTRWQARFEALLLAHDFLGLLWVGPEIRVSGLLIDFR